MNIDSIVTEIKRHEGFSGDQYYDHLGFPTIGYGTKLPLSKRESEVILRMRLIDMLDELKQREPIFNTIPVEAQEIIANMAYQLGVSGVLRFQKMWAALQNHDFRLASSEMLDSKWKRQTPARAEFLAERMSRVWS